MSQKERLRKLFESCPGQWIPLPKIIDLGIAMYPPRIKELREDPRNPMDIKNKEERIGGVSHSFYMYTPKKTFVVEPSGQLALAL